MAGANSAGDLVREEPIGDGGRLHLSLLLDIFLLLLVLIQEDDPSWIPAPLLNRDIKRDPRPSYFSLSKPIWSPKYQLAFTAIWLHRPSF